MAARAAPTSTRAAARTARSCASASRFMTELYRHLGEYTDVPAGDIGVGGREIGYMFGQYKRLTNRYEAGVLTGKGLVYGGSRARTEATGYGAAISCERCWPRSAAVSTAERAVVSGSGNVAIYTIEKMQSFGGKVVACSDSSGYVVDENGIDLALVKEIKDVRRGRISEYAQAKGAGCDFVRERPRFGMSPAMSPCPPPPRTN